MCNIENIVFSAGSMGGLTLIGAWKCLADKGLHSNIRGFSGCSIGSVVALLTSLGYTNEELENLSLNFRYRDYNDLQFLNTFENLGIETGRKLEKLLSKLIYHKVGRFDITFAEHYTITGKDLWINASCVQEDKCYYFSRFDFPRMSVLQAVRMSIAIPIVISAVRYHGKTFVDGGFHDPCPAEMFPSDKTLVLRVKNTNNVSEDEYDFIKHIGLIAYSIQQRINYKTNCALSKYKTLWLESGIGMLTLDLKKKLRKKLVVTGYKTMYQYLESNNIKC